MISKIKRVLENSHFEFKHLLVLLFILISFQVIVSFVHKKSLEKLLYNTQNWYQLDSAERLANLIATSLELLLETTIQQQTTENKEDIILAFNTILSQQILEHDIEKIYLIIEDGDKIAIIDDGQILYLYYFDRKQLRVKPNSDQLIGATLYKEFRDQLIDNEQTISIPEDGNAFNVLVPFVPKGEFTGVVYVRSKPNITTITEEIISSYNEIAIIFVFLILLGLLSMFIISSFTVKQRDRTQELLYKNSKKLLLEQINHQKESQFTNRIYHTHHKAEKIMGFIKEDLRTLTKENIDYVTYQITKYANFISRVIYDMKSYDPPLATIRNPLFKTNINEVITFLVNSIFKRIADADEIYDFQLSLDKNFPIITINEFVVWEILEPLIQNSIDHSGNNRKISIHIETRYEPEKKYGYIVISDNGNGIPEEMLEKDENGVKKIFLEHISSKSDSTNSGFGCYIAYEIAKQRCNWDINAENLKAGGCQMVISITNI